MKKDLNLFTAYKNGSAKIGGKSNAGIFLLIAAFLLIIAGAYGTLFFFNSNIKYKTGQIQKRLSDSAMVKDQKELDMQLKKNNLLIEYRDALKIAQKNFDASIKIDQDLFGKISSSMPSTVSVNSLKITPQSIQISCDSSNALDPAALAQALNEKGVFDNITYDGVVRDDNKENSKYFFTLTCNLKEKAE